MTKRGGPRLSQQQFIAAAKEKHGDHYDYSETVYTLAKGKIIVICPVHGSFTQTASAHLNYGCRSCGNARSGSKRRDSVDDFIARAEQIHQFKYDYHLVAFERQHQKVDIICPKHGAFKQFVNDHLKGRGCSKCGSESTSSKRKGILGYTTEDFIKKSITVHGDRYNYEETVYRGSTEPVSIICRDHGVFHQSAHNHLQAYGCLKCGITKKSTRSGGKGKHNNAPMLFSEFEQKARDIHGDRYDYKYYSKLAEKVGIECSQHGLFMQSGTDHLYAQAGCPACANSMIQKRLRYTRAEFETKLAEKWEDRVILIGEYYDLSTTTTFSCLAHGEFETTPNHVLNRQSPCSECWNSVRGTKFTQVEFEAQAAHTHQRKYQYGTYNGTDNKIDIECPKHGLFRQNAGNHLSGMGCPSCGQHRTAMQNKWLDTMGIKDREIWLRFDNNTAIKVDGYDPITKTVYEFWGDFWHGNPRLYQSDEINRATGTSFGSLYQKTLNKRRLITEQGYKLIEIWEQDWKRIDGKTIL